VTLNITGALRGCMGWWSKGIAARGNRGAPNGNLGGAGPAFPPRCARTNCPKLTFEISVLSRAEIRRFIRDVEVGKHGVLLEKGYNRATFLPQVAPEQGWTATHAQHLAMKAGLPPDAWKSGAPFRSTRHRCSGREGVKKRTGRWETGGRSREKEIRQPRDFAD